MKRRDTTLAATLFVMCGALTTSAAETPALESSASHPQILSRAVASVGASLTSQGRQYPPLPQPSPDPLRNGAIIGAVVGAATGGLLGTVGCGVGSGFMRMTPPEKGECVGATIAGAVVGMGLGALIGVGIDAMFERAPYAGTRRGVRVTWRF